MRVPPMQRHRWSRPAFLSAHGTAQSNRSRLPFLVPPFLPRFAAQAALLLRWRSLRAATTWPYRPAPRWVENGGACPQGRAQWGLQAAQSC